MFTESVQLLVHMELMQLSLFNYLLKAVDFWETLQSLNFSFVQTAELDEKLKEIFIHWSSNGLQIAIAYLPEERFPVHLDSHL